MNLTMHICPVCAYRGMPFPPVDCHICPCCGTEFGVDDLDLTHEELRTRWVSNGMPWFSRVTRPDANWDPSRQLLAYDAC